MSAMARNSKARQTPIRKTAPDLAPKVTGGPANTGDAIFEESSALLLYGQPIQHQR
jgi:hypothetical protein